MKAKPVEFKLAGTHSVYIVATYCLDEALFIYRQQRDYDEWQPIGVLCVLDERDIWDGYRYWRIHESHTNNI